jgi:acetyl esterase
MKGFRLLIVGSGLLVIIFAVFIFQTKSFAPIRPEAKTSGIVVQKDIAYGKHPKQKLDLCKPKNLEGRAPAVILIHGGGGDKSQHLTECKALARNGLVAIAVNFREEPYPSYQAILLDNRNALNWLKARAEVDSEKIAAMGGSLGGYVSSMAGPAEFKNKVNCVVNNFGPTDFTDEELEGSPLKDDFVEKFFGGMTYEENPELYEDLSPIFNVSANDAQSWLFTRSTNDQLVPRSQMTRMIDALTDAGIKTEFYEYSGRGEGHANKLPFWQASKLLNKRVSFLVNCLHW